MKVLSAFFIISILIFNNIISFSQESTDKKQIYESFDEVIGLYNTDLYKGIIYKDNVRRMRNNTNFFHSNNFLNINIKYNNNWYYDIEGKYDLYQQKVLVRLLDMNDNYVLIELINQNIDEFIIEDKRFVKVKGKNGFYELVLDLEYIKAYKKHEKKRKEVYEEGRLYDRFKIEGNNLIVNYKNDIFKIRKDKDFLKILKDAKQLKKIIKINKKYRNTDKELFFIKMLEAINSLLLI